MTSRVSRNMGFLSILLSGLFLFHPVVAFVDVLPNCIGYLLLYAGLSRLADLDSKFLEARKRFGILTILGVLQILFSVIIYRMPATVSQDGTVMLNPYEQPVYILLGAFVMLVFEWYFLIPAFRSFFSGLEVLADRHEVASLKVEKRGKTALSRLSRSLRIYVILSSVLAVLPELSILTSFEKDIENTRFPFDWYEYVGLFRLLCGTASAILGLICLVAFVRFFAKLLRETAFLEALKNRYTGEILPQTGMLTVRRFSAAFLLLQIGIIFSIGLRMNFQNALPSGILAIFALIALYLVKNDVRQKRGFYAVGCSLIAVSGLQLLVNALYLQQYTEPTASIYLPEAYLPFLIVRSLSVIEALLTLVLIGMLLQILYSAATTHTGVDYGENDSAGFSQAATERLHLAFGKRICIVFVIFSLAAILNVADAILQVKYEWLWLIGFLISFVGICTFYSLINELKTQIQFYYHSDGMNKNL